LRNIRPRDAHGWFTTLRAVCAGDTPLLQESAPRIPDRDGVPAATTFTNVTNAGSVSLTTTVNATSALTKVKLAINQLASDRATVGANQAALNMYQEQLGTLKDNMSAANSRIKDIDVAEESTNFAKYNILVQAGTAMLSQANSSSQSVLRLLG
jgi:flagellin